MEPSTSAALFDSYILRDDSLIAGLCPSELARQLEDKNLISHETSLTILSEIQGSSQDQVTKLLKCVHSQLSEKSFNLHTQWDAYIKTPQENRRAFLEVLHKLGAKDLAKKMEKIHNSLSAKDLTENVHNGPSHKIHVRGKKLPPTEVLYSPPPTQLHNYPPPTQAPPGKWYTTHAVI